MNVILCEKNNSNYNIWMLCYTYTIAQNITYVKTIIQTMICECFFLLKQKIQSNFFIYNF